MKKTVCIGLLVMVLAFGMAVVGCASSYHIQAFSNDINPLIYNSQFGIYEGMFEGSSYEGVLKEAKAAGYTKILSIEYGTKRFLGIFGKQWVIIRCVKE